MDGFFCRRLPEGSSEHILQDFGGQTDERRRKKKREFLPSSSSSRNTAKMRGKRAAHDSPHQPNISPSLFSPRPRTGKKIFFWGFFYGAGNTGTVKQARKKQALNIFLSSFFRDICRIPFPPPPPRSHFFKPDMFFCCARILVGRFFFPSVSWQFGLG